MGQRKVYTESTKKEIKLGNLLCSVAIVVGIICLCYGSSFGWVLLISGILWGFWYKLLRWWEHS